MRLTIARRAQLRSRAARGFTLIELAVVLGIIGVLLASLLLPLGTQVEQRQVADTTRRLEDAREALIGFAIVNGRLPCPAIAASNGAESFVGAGCSSNYQGFLPAVTLGIQPTDAQGFAIDAWGNRIRYAVSSTTWGSAPFARFTKQHNSADPAAAWTISTTPNDLVVCNTATGSTATTCAAGASVTNLSTVVAVLVSTGKNFAAIGSGGTDEAENTDADGVFVGHEPRPAGAGGGEFDDILVWLPVGILYNRMISAGVLP